MQLLGWKTARISMKILLEKMDKPLGAGRQAVWSFGRHCIALLCPTTDYSKNMKIPSYATISQAFNRYFYASHFYFFFVFVFVLFLFSYCSRHFIPRILQHFPGSNRSGPWKIDFLFHFCFSLLWTWNVFCVWAFYKLNSSRSRFRQPFGGRPSPTQAQARARVHVHANRAC